MVQLVLTGFRAFPGVPENPSQVLVEHLAANDRLLPDDTHCQLLDVHYASVGDEIDRLLALRPQAILLTGYSSLATGVTLESRATGLCAEDKPDAQGTIFASREDDTLHHHGLDLDALAASLVGKGIIAEVSQDAGQYLCNFSYRHALAAIAARRCGTRALFVHVPALKGTPLAREAAAAMPLDMLAGALGLIGRQLLEG